MMRSLLTMAVVVGCVAAVRAGGLPPVYVVIDEVVVEPAKGDPERVVIKGSFVRMGCLKERKYGTPVAGEMHLGLSKDAADKCRDEWKLLAKAAGTGRAVPVGHCSDGGVFLKADIRKAGDRPAKPDATYTPGYVQAEDITVEKMWWASEPPVKALLAFVKENKAAPAASAKK